MANDYSKVYDNFYCVERAGLLTLTDGGGPFGFDITVATIVDYLIRAYACDGIVETGTFLGDTLVYLARTYRHLPIVSFEIRDDYARIAQIRTQSYPNVHIHHGDSAVLTGTVESSFDRPLYFLDAHGYEQWPLVSELRRIRHGIVVIHDFDIGHSRFSCEHLGETACDEHLLQRAGLSLTEYYVNDPYADYPFPCLQIGRRAGIAVLPLGLSPEPAMKCNFLSKRLFAASARAT